MYGLVANVISDKALRIGGKVRIIRDYSDANTIEVSGQNKQGRMITKQIPWKRLTNIRAAFLPEVIGRFTGLWWDDKASANAVAAELTEIWKDVRIFRPDGTLLKDGITAAEGWNKNQPPANSIRRSICSIDSIERRLKEIRTQYGRGRYYAVQDE